MKQYLNSAMDFLQLFVFFSLFELLCQFELFLLTVCNLLQASQLLRQLCMQNMVWTYCKRISPEWKQQVPNNFVFIQTILMLYCSIQLHCCSR